MKMYSSSQSVKFSPKHVLSRSLKQKIIFRKHRFIKVINSTVQCLGEVVKTNGLKHRSGWEKCWKRGKPSVMIGSDTCAAKPNFETYAKMWN